MRVLRGSLLAWALAVSVLGAQETRTLFTLFGQVSQPDGTPAPRAVVSIEGPTGLKSQVAADDMGRFEIPDVPRGRYRLTAMNPGAPTQYTDPVQLDLGRAFSNRVAANIYLRNAVDTTSPREDRTGPVVSVAEAAQDVPKAARKAFDQAIKCRAEKKFDDALKNFGRAIELYPSFFQAYSERGHMLIGLGKAPEAAQDFARALELNPLYGPALRGSGLCKFQQGRYAEAIRDLERAADAEPGNATNYLFMGTADVALDRREQARAALLKALSIDPAGSVRAHVHLANLSIRENKPGEALAELETYLAKVPDAPDKEKLVAIASQLRSSIKQ